jgi:dolichol-phosphate mannosyltransferase
MSNTVKHIKITEKVLDYSIIIPVYFNEGCLEKTMQSVKKEVIDNNPELTCEVIFIDDGSRDRSFDELMLIRREHPELVRVIKLTRNFGQASALLAGFNHARGKCVVAMSADGQDPPELINDMLNAYFKEGYEIAVCTRKGRDESFYRVITSRFFYYLIKKLTFPEMPLGGFDFILLGERAQEYFLRNMDVHPFVQGQILWMGFKTKFVSYHRRQRTAGKSQWTFAKKLTYLIDGVLAYSFVPLRFSSFAGIILAFAGFLYASIIFFERLLFGHPVEGWAPLMIVILVIGGFQLLMMGVVGEYIWRTLAQTRNRDMYIIDEFYEVESDNISTD